MTQFHLGDMHVWQVIRAKTKKIALCIFYIFHILFLFLFLIPGLNERNFEITISKNEWPPKLQKFRICIF